MFVIGTAGHVDHGKSSLVRALTGIDPDRLPEEKQREMTIDLGFAWLTLDNGQEVGIVDVPGHERFIKNMIAGAGAVNAVLFVVAADDGWMPQSQEHLDILELLQIKHSIIVLTKIDLVQRDWLNLVRQDIRRKVKNTFLESSQLIEISATQGIGIEELKQEISAMLGRMALPKDAGKPRLFIDRIFTMAGRGTVVTGTLTDGKLQTNQEVEILPQQLKSRIREIQTHKKSLNQARPGNRVALNLSGLEKQALQRGDVIVTPNQDQAVSLLYIDLRLLPQIQWSLKRPVLLQVMLGSAEVLGAAILLDRKELLPGENGLVELRLKEPLVPRLGDRVILRLPGPQMTIGGGPMLDWSASTKTPDRDFLIQLLQNRRNLQLPDLIITELEKHGFIKPSDLLKSSHFSKAEIQLEVEKLLTAQKIQRQGEFVCHSLTVNRLKEGLLKQLEDFHREFPYNPGLKVQELASRLKTDPGVLQIMVEVLEREKLIAEKQGYLALSSHQPRLTGALQKKLETVLRTWDSSPFSPPSRKELVIQDSDYDLVITYLIQNGELLELRDGLLFRTADLKAVEVKVRDLILQKGQVSVSDVRETLATSRKYAVPILEKLDQLGITKRKGDYRVLNER